VMKEPYQFLVVDYKAAPSKRFRHGWTKHYSSSPLRDEPLKAIAEGRPDV
jgi:hypothetical protein